VHGGLGSRLTKLKVGLSMALALNLTFISPPLRCWQAGHGVDAREAYRFFAWGRGASCRARNVEMQLDADNSNNDTFQPLLRIDELLRKPLTKVKFEQLMSWHEPKRIANDSSSDSREPRLMRLVAARLSKLSAAQRRSTVFLIASGGNFPTHGSLLARRWMRARYHERFAQQRRALHYFTHGERAPSDAQVLPPLAVASSLDNNNNNNSSNERHPSLFVAIHARRGDALAPNALFRTRWLWWYAAVARQITAAARNVAHARFFVFSEGNSSEFEALRRDLPQAHVVLGTARSVFTDIDHMAHAHVLVGHVSSFSRLAAELKPARGALLLSRQPDHARFRNNMLGGGNTLLEIDDDRAEFDLQALRALIPSLVNQTLL
jgi:hypothetical protein